MILYSVVLFQKIPEHIIANMKRIIPDQDSDDGGLTMENIQESASSDNGGVWILRCTKDVRTKYKKIQ